MAVAQGYITIDEIIKEYMLDKEEQTLHNYVLYLNHALRALREIKLSHGLEKKTASLTVASNKTADYPSDMLKWHRIGVKKGDRILLYGKDGDLIADVDSGGNSSYVRSVEEDQTYIADYHGYDYNGSGYFTDDPENQRFIFSAEVTGTDVFIEYSTTGIVASTQTQINAIAIELVKRFIDMGLARSKYGPASNQFEGARREYIREQHKVAKRKSDLSYDALIDILIANRHTEHGLSDGYTQKQGVFDFV